MTKQTADAKRIPQWDSLAENWHDSGPPASPSAGDIEIYDRFVRYSIENSANPQIMLLGSTPSLRTLLARFDLPVTCVDASKKMVARTSASVSLGNPRESFAYQNWLQVNLSGTTFSTIIGDMVLNNVPYERWEMLKRRLITHLRGGAFVVTRVAPNDSSTCGHPFTELLRLWSERFDRGLALQKAACGLWQQAVRASARAIPGKLSISVIEDEINSINRTIGHLTQPEAAVMNEFTRIFHKSFEHEWTAYTLGNVIDLFAEELTLIKIARATDYSASRQQPILMFQYLS